MNMPEIRDTARDMIRSYGLQAQAIAAAHAAELAQGPAAEQERWQQIHAVICELRRAGARPSSRQTAQ